MTEVLSANSLNGLARGMAKQPRACAKTGSNIEVDALKTVMSETLRQFRIRVSCPSIAIDQVRSRLECSPFVDMGTDWAAPNDQKMWPCLMKKSTLMKTSAEGATSFALGHIPWHTRQEIKIVICTRDPLGHAEKQTLQRGAGETCPLLQSEYRRN